MFRIVWTTLLTAACLMAGPLGAAQESPVVGVWQHSEAAKGTEPASTMMLALGPDGRYELRWAIAPRPGQVGVMVVTRGTYQMGGNAMVSVPMWRQSCSSGGACMTCGENLPPQMCSDIGQRFSQNVELRGGEQMLMGEATWFRMR